MEKIILVGVIALLVVLILILVRMKSACKKTEKFSSSDFLVDQLNMYNFASKPVPGDTSAQLFVKNPILGVKNRLLDVISDLAFRTAPEIPKYFTFGDKFILRDEDGTVLASVSKGCGGTGRGHGFKFMRCSKFVSWYPVPWIDGEPSCPEGQEIIYPEKLETKC